MGKINFNATTVTKFLGNAEIKLLSDMLVASAPVIDARCEQVSGINSAYVIVTNTDVDTALVIINDIYESQSYEVTLLSGQSVVLGTAFGISTPYSYRYSAYATIPGKTNSTTTIYSGSHHSCFLIG